MKIFNFFTAALLLLSSASAWADINSPYSKFGYGILGDNASSAQSQMGGVGYALNSGRQINVMNPASYAASDTLTFLFDMGLDFSMINFKEAASADAAAASSHQYGGGLDYVTMQVPIGKNMGASLGLIPFSSVGYSFGSEIANGINSRQGSGGVSQLYIGYGAKIYKGLSAGFNFSYLFGTTINDVYVYTNSSATSSSTSLYEQVMQIRDWRIQFGLQYSLDLNADNRLTAGLVYTPGKTLAGKAWVCKYDVDQDTKPDTVAYGKLRHNASLPATWGAGLSWRWQRRLNIGLDFTYQPWSKVKMIDLKDKSGFNAFQDTKFANRWKIALGGEFTPSMRGSYLSRVTYRAGAFLNHDYVMVGSNNVRDWGISCGFGLPAASTKTLVNLGFEYHHRQATPNPLLQESYFNIKLGINFNELWFFQNKIR